MNPLKTCVLIALTIIALPLCTRAQRYTPVLHTNLEPKKLGCVATGDLNNDGYLDIVTSGITEADEMSTTVYINQANGSFEELPINFASVYNSTISLGDYNNDDYLDILINGEGWTQQWAVLWKNNGDLTFTKMSLGLDPLGGFGNCEFRDFDNDGWLDVVLSGDIRLSDESYMSNTRVYKNLQGTSFERVDQEFSSYARFGTFGDYDNDGDLDLAVGGAQTSFKIYPNFGDGTFGEPIKPQLPNTPYGIGWFDYDENGLFEIPHLQGQIEWLDYNNDGRLDLLLWGRGEPVVSNSLMPFSLLLENTGDPLNPFQMIETDFASGQREQIDIRDYNADGRSDIIVTAITSFDPFDFVNTVYDNAENGFVPNSGITLPPFWGGDAMWLDHDNDGDLDMLLTGQETYEEEIIGDHTIYRTSLLRNDAGSNTFSENKLPSPPDEIQWEWHGDSVTFIWTRGSDAETPQAVLTYNIAIGRTPNEMNVLNPESNIKTGQRKIARTGNAAHTTTKTIIGLNQDSTYYFRIQTVDGAMAGSLFSEAKLISGTAVVDTTSAEEVIDVYPNPSSNFVVIHLSTSDAKNNLKIYSNTGYQVNVEIEQLSSTAFRLDLSSIKQGIYILDAVVNGKRIHRKIIKN